MILIDADKMDERKRAKKARVEEKQRPTRQRSARLQ